MDKKSASLADEEYYREMGKCTDKCLQCPDREEILPVDLEKWCSSCENHNKLRTLEKTRAIKNWGGALEKHSVRGEIGEQ
jgi:hypothetical protein